LIRKYPILDKEAPAISINGYHDFFTFGDNELVISHRCKCRANGKFFNLTPSYINEHPQLNGGFEKFEIKDIEIY
jgi:hypothetical protein